MKKYKIVKFIDGNEEEYFEVWVQNTSILTDIFNKWVVHNDARYTNLKQAQYAVRSMKIEHNVVEEGVIND